MQWGLHPPREQSTLLGEGCRGNGRSNLRREPWESWETAELPKLNPGACHYGTASGTTRVVVASEALDRLISL